MKTALRRLLLVDGDPAARPVIAAHLGGAFTIVHALTRREGRAALRRHPVDLVLLESRLPDESGLRFLAEIRRQYPALPVVMVTAHGSETVCAAAFRLGVRDYIAKPVDPALLLAAAARVVPAPSGRAPLPAAHAGSSPLTRDQQRIGEAVRFIHDHYAEPLALAQVARVCRMGRFSLSHAFPLVMRTTFRAYLQRLRITRATELLGDTGHSITEIAEMVGFGDLSRFNKAFKKQLGLPPTGYRKQVMLGPGASPPEGGAGQRTGRFPGEAGWPPTATSITSASSPVS